MGPTPENKGEDLMTHERIMQLPVQTRSSRLSGVDATNRIIHFSFSSETPVMRRYGWEVLSHQPGALRTARLDAGAVPFLVQHDHSQAAGKVVNYQLGLGKNYASAKIYRSPMGDQLLRDVADGRTEISCGYICHKMELTRGEPGADDNIYTVTDFEVTELSSVSVPADATVGVGRGLDEQLYECRVMAPSCEYATRGTDEEAEVDRIRREWAEAQEQEEQRIRARDERVAKIQFYWDPAAASGSR